ncbi:hypothetical protein [Capsulimonas corticalis]|nr:hypothetical protein [Capsulimonas corticalis]
MTTPSNRGRWTEDWRGFLVGGMAGVVCALALAVGYYLVLIFCAPHLVYQGRTHVLGWVLCQVILALVARRLFGKYPVIAASGSITGILALAAAFFELSLMSQVGI